MFTENLNDFFDEEEFAVSAVVTLPDSSTRSIKVIFDQATERVDLYSQNIEANIPTCMAKTSDLSGVKTKRQIVVDGKTFLIERISHDGTGISTIYLKA